MSEIKIPMRPLEDIFLLAATSAEECYPSFGGYFSEAKIKFAILKGQLNVRHETEVRKAGLLTPEAL
jgi:hypothetical protein